MLGMMGDKKKLISIILSEKAHKPKEEEVSSGLESDFSGGYESIASDVMSAVKSGDSKKLASSLKEFMQMCMSEDEYSDDGEDRNEESY
jgi:hypothetical protein